MPKEKKTFWSFKALANGVGELFLYGIVESQEPWWSDGDTITPKRFKQDLYALGDVTTINVYINSDGGDVFAGQAIHSMLKRHKAHINVYVDGIAASIASVVAMAGDTVYMPRNAMMMIHNPMTGGWGNAERLRKLADQLDSIAESMIAAYEDKSGQTHDKIVEIMGAETWLSADEAVELGFADEIEDSMQVAASLNAGVLKVNGQEMDLSKFKHPPKLAFLPPDNPETEKKPPIVKQESMDLLSLYEKKLELQGRVLK